MHWHCQCWPLTSKHFQILYKTFNFKYQNYLELAKNIKHQKSYLYCSLIYSSQIVKSLWGGQHQIGMHRFDQIITDEKFLLLWLQADGGDSDGAVQYNAIYEAARPVSMSQTFQI